MSAKNVTITISGNVVATAGYINWIQGTGTTYTVAVNAQTDYITVTDDAGGASGAPSTSDYLVGTSDAGLSAEIVVGTSPGGELGGTWASPTVDASHSGSTHAAAAATETTDIRAVDVLVGTTTSAFSGEIVVGTSPGGELGGTWASPTVDATHSGSTHAAATTTHEAAGDPHTGYQLESAVSTQITFSTSGTLATATGAFRWYNTSGRTLTFASAVLGVGTAPTGAAILVDVNVDGTTVFSSQGNRPTIAISAFTGSTTTFNTTTIATGAHYITVDIDQIGSTIAGSNLTVTIWMTG